MGGTTHIAPFVEYQEKADDRAVIKTRYFSAQSVHPTPWEAPHHRIYRQRSVALGTN